MGTKTFSFDNDDRGGVSADEPIYGMQILLTVDDDLVVREVETAVTASAFAICGDIAGRYRSLKSLSIGSGRTKSVTRRPGTNPGLHAPDGNVVGPVSLGRLSDRFGSKEG